MVMTACNHNTLYSSYLSVDNDGWTRQDTLVFTTDPMEHAGNYIEEVGLRINSTFPFTALTLIVEQQASPSDLSRIDTLYVILTDKEGTVQGDGISLYQYSQPLPPMKLLKGDTLTVAIRHDMLRQQLKGITDIGFTLRKAP